MDTENLPVPGQHKTLMPNPQMMLEIASGLEEGWEIADRYGYTTREWEQMSAQEGFQKQIAALTAEMKLSGVTFQRKAAMIAEELLTDILIMAKNSKSLSELLDVARFAARMGKLEPQTGDKGSAGGGTTFAVQFNFSGAPPQQMTVTPEMIRQINPEVEVTDVAIESVVHNGGVGRGLPHLSVAADEVDASGRDGESQSL